MFMSIITFCEKIRKNFTNQFLTGTVLFDTSKISSLSGKWFEFYKVVKFGELKLRNLNKDKTVYKQKDFKRKLQFFKDDLLLCDI